MAVDVVVDAAVVVVDGGVTTDDVGETIVLVSKFIVAGWFDKSGLDRESPVLEAPVSMTSLVLSCAAVVEVTGPMQPPCWTKAETLVPFWAMLATM